MKKRLLIVGGVAAGASCAARARRLSEETEIIIFERGNYVSFANCGLPYYVGHKIKIREKLLVATPDYFKRRFQIEVRLEHEVTAIDRGKKTITVMDLKSGQEYTEQYDFLMLAPGARAVKPPVKGADIQGIFTVKTIPDADDILDWISRHKVHDALIIGGGFIGCEMAENLHELGIKVRIVEMLPQLMPQVDAEMAWFIHSHVKQSGITLSLHTKVMEFERDSESTICVTLSSGEVVKTGIVISATGVRPDTALAKEAGLAMSPSGGITVDNYMQTSDPAVWAAGDAVESIHVLSGKPVLLPLAGPANRQGRLAADVMMGTNPEPFRGVQGTFVCGIAGLTVASTGLGERNCKDSGIQYEKIYLSPYHHAGYYPGAAPVTMKLVFSKPDGKILGAQSVGMEGVDKRIDVISMAIQNNGTVYDLEQAELCYAPQYGSAKDPVNMAGMIAVNILRGFHPVAHWDDIKQNRAFILDVRTKREYQNGHYPDAVNIPLDTLRNELDKIPGDREILVYCLSGQRSYYAVRILLEYGFNAKNIPGGYMFYRDYDEYDE
ncbi:MAG: FAD-dependent oxidoreductase [Spirochaetales bacterium]|nr:FAD-dependent oxidoreductase [Spirochaetales bacterium]